MWILLLASVWAATPEPQPLVDYTKLQELHLCLDDFAPNCYHLKRSEHAAEFEKSARKIVERVKFPVSIVPDCAPRLAIHLKYADREIAGYLCRDRYSKQEWAQWSSYLR